MFGGRSVQVRSCTLPCGRKAQVGSASFDAWAQLDTWPGLLEPWLCLDRSPALMAWGVPRMEVAGSSGTVTGGHGLGQGWMGMGRIGLGALQSCGGREDSWRGLPEQDVVAQGVGWWQLVCSGRRGGRGRGGFWLGPDPAWDHLWACWLPAEHSQTKRPCPSSKMFQASHKLTEGGGG